jgi:hypothetical protein
MRHTTEGEAAEGVGDRRIAVKWWTKASDEGAAEAQSVLGAMYASNTPDDEAVKVDFVEGARLLGLAASKGVMGAQYNLGALYAKGKGVERDVVKAKKLIMQVSALPLLLCCHPACVFGVSHHEVAVPVTSDVYSSQFGRCPPPHSPPPPSFFSSSSSLLLLLVLLFLFTLLCLRSP